MDDFTPIKDFEKLYGINKKGDVFGYKRAKILKQKTNRYGYKTIKLCKNNQLYYFMVHRLVAQTFINNPNNLPQVNHKDGVKSNNKVDNLEWCTQSENMKHAYRMGLEKKKCKKVCQYDAHGSFLKIFDSIKDASLYFGLKRNSYHLVQACKNGKKYNGFFWKFYQESDSNEQMGKTEK